MTQGTSHWKAQVRAVLLDGDSGDSRGWETPGCKAHGVNFSQAPPWREDTTEPCALGWWARLKWLSCPSDTRNHVTQLWHVSVTAGGMYRTSRDLCHQQDCLPAPQQGALKPPQLCDPPPRLFSLQSLLLPREAPQRGLWFCVVGDNALTGLSPLWTPPRPGLPTAAGP